MFYNIEKAQTSDFQCNIIMLKNANFESGVL